VRIRRIYFGSVFIECDVNCSDESEKILTEEDKLYLVPAEMKVKFVRICIHIAISSPLTSWQALEGRSIVDNSQKGDGTGLAWTTGIAEVALPIDFKLRNIEATEAARRKQEEDKEARRELKRISQMQKTLCLGNTTTALIRQQQLETWKSEHVSTSKNGVSGGSGGSGSSQQQIAHQPGAATSAANSASVITKKAPAGFEKSSDDFTLGKFLKNQRNFKR
jgi:hypothetical protein